MTRASPGSGRIISDPLGDLAAETRARGRELASAGIRLQDLVFDLDETLWDWRLRVAWQPRIAWAHDEHVFVRWPLLWLLEGIAERGPGPLRVWTSGYGLRVDLVCKAVPQLGRILGLGDGTSAEASRTVMTRLDFARALERAPSILPARGRWSHAKVPGAPTAAGKPLVDAARVLADDKESNCRAFVEAGGGRSAIWLRGTSRVWADSIHPTRVLRPAPRSWTRGVADALDSIARGANGLFPVSPEPGGPELPPVRVTLPHIRVWSDWIAPGRRSRELVARRSREAEARR